MIKLAKSIRDNLHFLCVEVDGQIANLQKYLATPVPALASRVIDRRGYAYNLKMRIHTSCAEQLAAHADKAPTTLTYRAIEFVATELERLTELARTGINQLNDVESFERIQPSVCRNMLNQVRKAIGLIESAIEEPDSKTALNIGEQHQQIQKRYAKLLKNHASELKGSKHTQDYIAAVLVCHTFKQMGDALLDISEAIISAKLGQTVSLERYASLQSLLDQINVDEQDLQVEPIAETRSGSAIAGISAPEQEGYLAIFKDGEKRKVKEERQGVNSWHEIYPGLAPKILSYKKRGESAALLIEHLPGYTFEHILLNEPEDLLDEALKQLSQTLKSVWVETLRNETAQADYTGQLQKRLPEVYKIHPEFKQSDSKICDLTQPSFNTLLMRASKLEAKLKAPFSVYIHGDFNLDNIIYDPLEKRINFIDLHRSRYMDYVQDVSVFMVSNYRLQILDAETRSRILSNAQAFYKIVRRFALKQKDSSFELRLALGLARSFASSTRFILDKSLARRMMLRAHYLLQLSLAVPSDKIDKFKLPLKEIFSE